MELWHDVRRAVALLVGPIVVGTIGYVLLGLDPVGALYQTVTTLAAVGFLEVDGPFGTAERLFTIFLIVAGILCVAYAVGIVLNVFVERRIAAHMAERRMSRAIAGMTGHNVVCGLGRVGRIIAEQLSRAGRTVVVIDTDQERLTASGLPHVVGDATVDEVLQAAGVERASTLIAALDTDAANLYVALSSRALNPGLFVVARARDEHAAAKLRQAGADRVVNPQHIGGARMAALALQPNVAEFLDVVVQEGDLEFRLEELVLADSSALVGASLRAAQIRERSGALVLALRRAGTFSTNPDPSLVMQAGDVLIAIGMRDQLDRLAAIAGSAP
ncbi:MAG TPA: potassium channel protein [Acidimicrobiales bacterium]